MKAGARTLFFCASNPLSTQDDVAAALVEYGIPTNAIKGEDGETYYKHIMTALDHKPQVTTDDGADLVSTMHTKRKELIKNVIGGTEETTTGVIRLRSMAKANALKYPIIAVNDAETKYLFDNRYGTGQSTMDGITRATNFSGPVKSSYFAATAGADTVSDAGQRHGRARRRTEVKPVRALEAAMDGFEVMPIAEAAKIGDVFVTITGDKNVIDKEHFALMKDGAIMANSGHFNVEINIPALESLAKKKETIRPFVEQYTLKNGKKLFLLGEGRLINLAAAEGHPASVMDMSFGNQALCMEYLIKNQARLEKKVYSVPDEIDKKVASLKLASMGIKIDKLTPEQQAYLESWQEGT